MDAAAIAAIAAVSIVPERTADVGRAAELLRRDGAVVVTDRAVDEAALAALLRELLGDRVTNVGAAVEVRSSGGRDRPDMDADGHTIRMPMHTDGFALADAAPDVLALAVEHAARCGGGASFVIDARALHAHLTEIDPDFARWLVEADVDQTEPGKVPAIGPIGVQRDGRTWWRCSYCLAVPAGDPDPAATQAGLDRWLALLEALGAGATRFQLVDGDVLVADNAWVFHGRDPYEDTDRLFWRIWAWTDAALAQSDYAGSDTSLVQAP
jgi:hypothetical protein